MDFESALRITSRQHLPNPETLAKHLSDVLTWRQLRWQQQSNSPDNYSENLMREVKRLNASGNALGTAEDRCYASSTVYGSAFINKGLDLITEEIARNLNKICAGHASEYAKEVQAVSKCDPGVLALITAKSTLDVLGLRRLTTVTYQALTTHIGRAIYHQVMLDDFCDKHPELFKQAKQHLHDHKGYLYKVQRYRAVMRRNEIEPLQWSTTTKHKVGGWLLDRLSSATGWVALQRSPRASKRGIPQ
jgi:hypothetical protein